MMLSLSITVFSLVAEAAPTQDPVPALEQVVRRYEKGILKIDGVKEIVPDQAGGKVVVTVRVETSDARDMVALITHENLEGYPVRIVVSKDPLPPRSGTRSPERKETAGTPACAHCRIHCPTDPERKSESAGREKPPSSDPEGASKKPEAVCSRCPLHCKDAESDTTVSEPAPPQKPPAAPGGADKPASPEPLCDVARKLRGLPPLKSGRTGCEEIVSTSNNPERIRWAIEKSLPHWLSKEMSGVKGNGPEAIPCPAHGGHSLTEFVCYSWVRHGKLCPMRDVLSPKDLAPPAQK